MRPLLKVPDELSILDIMCVGPPLKDPYKRWTKSPAEITHWDVFDRKNFMTEEELNTWIKEKRHKVMYKDAAKIDYRGYRSYSNRRPSFAGCGCSLRVSHSSICTACY